MKATAKRLVNQQQPPMFWIMNDPRYHHRFPIDRHSQIVPAALFKMLKTRDHAGQAANLRARCEIYVSRWRHKSCTGNEKRRVASPPRYPSENWNGCGHCNPFNLKVETIYYRSRYYRNHLHHAFASRDVPTTKDDENLHEVCYEYTFMVYACSPLDDDNFLIRLRRHNLSEFSRCVKSLNEITSLCSFAIKMNTLVIVVTCELSAL